MLTAMLQHIKHSKTTTCLPKKSSKNTSLHWVIYTGCPLFFNIDFPRLFHDQKMKIHDLSAQHIFPGKRYTRLMNVHQN